MSKGVKKGLIIGASIIGVILVVMILVPFLFKDKIKEAVLDVAKESLNAEIVVDDFGFNLFSNFPNATLSLNDASIIGVDEFESDTLFKAKKASVTIDLFSLFGDNYKINKIDLDDTAIYAKIAENGAVNWDIVKEDSTAVVEGEAESSSAFNLNLKDININNCSVVYEDFESNIKAYLYGWNGKINGDFSANETTLNTKSTINELTVMMDGIPFLSKVKTVADAKVKANFDDMKFTFIDSECFLNDLAILIDGSFAMLEEEGFDFNLNIDAPKADFKQILSLVPAMYTDDFKNVKTGGEVVLSAYMVGKMVGDIYPKFNLSLEVRNAMFQYPALPKSVDNINLLLSVNGEGGSIDNVIVLVDRFDFLLGGNPFKGSFRMLPAANDKTIKFDAEGKLDLGMIKDVYPLEGATELKGTVDANIKVNTTLSAIEKEIYENISASGHIKVGNLVYKSEDLPDVLVNEAALNFTPRYAELTGLDIKIGDSDIKATGRLENFIAYALKDQTLRGQLDVRSKYLNLDQLMGNTDTEEAATTEESGEDVVIPKNLNFVLNAAFTHVLFSQIDVTNISGAITVNNGVLSMNNLAASALGGLINVSGAYDTSEPKDPKVNFDMGLTRVSFAETFKHIEAVQEFAPIFEDIVGAYSMNLKFNTKLGATTSETLLALSGTGALQTSDVHLEGNKALSALGAALKTDKLNNISPKDLNLPFSIENGELSTKPFNVNLGDGGEMSLAGVTRLDQTIDYKGTIKLPKALNNDFVSKVPITIGGTFSKPSIGVDVKGAVTDAVGSVVGKLIGGSDSDGNSTGLAEKIGAEKTAQIAKMRSEADNAAEKIVDLAKKTADDAVKKAGSNVFAKAAAKKLGEEGVKAAEKEAQKLRDKAEEQIKKLEGETEPVATEAGEVTE